MSPDTAARRSSLSSSPRSWKPGALLLGLAAVSSGCGAPQEDVMEPKLQSTSQASSTDSYVVAYEGSFTGQAVLLAPGWHDTSALGLVGDNALSSLLVPSGWRVTLYNGAGFTGSTLPVLGDRDLTGRDFDNWTSSLLIEGPVVLYRDDGFHGRAQFLDLGDYDTAQLAGVGDNALSSLRVAPGYRVTLYSGSGFTGSTRVITADKDLWRNSDFNDQTSSLRVEGPVTIFQHDNYNPPSQNLQPGFYAANRLTFGPYALSALRVAPGWKVTLYSGDNFTGETRVITANTDLWLNGDFNDSTASIKVEGPTP